MNRRNTHRAVEGNKRAADNFALELYKCLTRDIRFKKFLVDVDASSKPISLPSLGRQLESLGYRTASGKTTWHRSTLANLVRRLRILGKDLRKVGLEPAGIIREERAGSKYLVTEARLRDIEKYDLLVNQFGGSDSKAFSYIMSLVSFQDAKIQSDKESTTSRSRGDHSGERVTAILAKRFLAQIYSGIPVSMGALKKAFTEEEMQIYYDGKREIEIYNSELRDAHAGLQRYTNALKKIDRLHRNPSQTKFGKDKLSSMYTVACDDLKESLDDNPGLAIALDREYVCGPSIEEVPRSIFSKSKWAIKSDKYYTPTDIKVFFLERLVAGKGIGDQVQISEEERQVEAKQSLQTLKKKPRLRADLTDWVL